MSVSRQQIQRAMVTKERTYGRPVKYSDLSTSLVECLDAGYIMEPCYHARSQDPLSFELGTYRLARLPYDHQMIDIEGNSREED